VVKNEARPMSEAESNPELNLDDHLLAIKRQIGEVAWSMRVAAAREQERIVLELKACVEKGESRAEALRRIDSRLKANTVNTWFGKYSRGGLVALIDRRGRPALGIQGSSDTLRTPTKRYLTKTSISFLKWSGSKQSILRELTSRMPTEFEDYFEPMMGSAALFLSLRPPHATLGDENSELVECFRLVRDRVDDLLEALLEHRNTEEHFYQVRALRAEDLSPLARAARLIFLNKTCFNGLYRQNRHGHFNVPYGRISNANIRDEEALRRVSGALQGVALVRGDFADLLDKAGSRAFVYLDPPYLALPHQQPMRYSGKVFGEDAHRRLARVCSDLHDRGCKVMISAGDHPLVRELFHDWNIEVIETRRQINPNAARRGGHHELLIRNYEGITGADPKQKTLSFISP